MMKLLKEFQTFAVKGNAMDLAVGVIIGAAFGKIVSSMVEDLLMPIVGVFGKADFSNWFVILTNRDAITDAARSSLVEAKKIGSTLAYGNFITVTINFLIVAFCIFILVKVINTARAKLEREQAAAPPPPPPPPSNQEVLLREIRDLLKARA